METKTKLLTPMIVVAMIMFCPSISYAQSTPTRQPEYEKLSIPSPDVWGFMKYGNTPTNLYHGIAQTSIPIYTYKDKDFELPISVEYASSGYIPNVQTGVLGLGWTLNAGGAITREVQGIPDDTSNDVGPDGVKGYMFYHKMTNQQDYTLDDIVDFPPEYRPGFGRLVFPDPIPNKSGKAETTSDIYHFKFGEHSGSFMLGPNRKIYVFNTSQPHGEYSIDLSELWDSSTNGNPNIISITTGNGYKYVFGGSTQYNLDRTYYDLDYDNPGLWYSNTGLSIYPYNISWRLSKIIAPNQREIVFGYSDIEETDFHRPYAFYSHEIGNESTSLNSLKSYWGYRKETRLTTINIDGDITIDFTYGDKEKERAPAELENLKQLESINVTYKDPSTQQSQSIKNCNFSYGISNKTISPPTDNPITFLTGLQISGENPYQFHYYNQHDSFPFHGAFAIDHWGYYNKKDRNIGQNLIPNLDMGNPYDASLNEKINSDYREPDFDGAQMGMLQTIRYPTGGYTVFEYEGNDYAQKLGKNRDPYTSYGDVWLFGANEGGGYTGYSNRSVHPAGGVRIRKITDYHSDSITVSNEREFFYERKDSNLFKNSGILLHYPRYYTNVTVHDSRVNEGQTWINRSGTNLMATSIDDYHIGYSSVIERFKNGSQNVYEFSNWDNGYNDPSTDVSEDMITSGDMSWGKVFKIIAIGDQTMVYEDVAKKFVKEPTSHHNTRGKLINKSAYDSSNRLINSHSYYYGFISGLEYAQSFKTTWAYAYRHLTLVVDRLLTEEREINYGPSGAKELETITNYEYNSSGQMTKTTTSRAGIDDIYTTHMSYLSTNDKVYQYPETTVRTHKSGTNGTEKIIDAQIINYQNIGTSAPMYKPTRIQRAYLSPDLTFSNLSSNLETELTNSYGLLGNLKEQTYRSVPTSYIWGYGGLYPVAIIQNASSASVTSKVPSPPSMALSDTREAALRTLPEASITTYKYKPFVGVSEIRDNSGRVVTYTYDTYGRLYSVKNDEGDLVNKYEYNMAVAGQGNIGPSGTSRNHNFILTNTYTGTGVNDYVADVDYYNGLGDLSQKVSIGASSKDGKSIVAPVYYDNMRRESRQYLPYTSASDGFDAQALTGANNQQIFYDNIYNGGAFSAADARQAYTENIYEPSPLSRVVEAYNVGAAFRTQNNEKKSTFTYGANTSTDGVKRFRLSGNTSQPLSVTSWPVNTLNKTSTVNEDGATSSIFTDMLGRTVLERIATDGADQTNFDTYYVYDDIGNLCYVLPPKLSEVAASWESSTIPEAIIKDLAYVYKYDGRNRCIEKRLPGAEPVYLVYDKGDRLVMSQDGNQRERGCWLYNVYDNLDRPVSQSLVAGNLDRSTIQSRYDAAGFDNRYPTLGGATDPYKPFAGSDFSLVAVLSENRYDKQ